MGLTGEYTDDSTGMVFPNAYVSLYQSTINSHKLVDTNVHVQYANEPSSKPADWDEAGGCHNCGHWAIDTQAKVYATEEARQANKNAVAVRNVHIFVNDLSTVTSAIYDKLKETYPSLEDC
jgi:hypothetical protein